MEKIILYGAGIRGKKIARLLAEKDIHIVAFLDLYKDVEEITIDNMGDGGGDYRTCLA